MGSNSTQAGMFVVSLEDPRLIGMRFAERTNGVCANSAEAVHNIEVMRTTVKESFGDVRYSDQGFPLSVSANRELGLVETKFPKAMDALIANPEVFLCWAQKMEEALMQITPSA
jgi:hypothetical protein